MTKILEIKGEKQMKKGMCRGVDKKFASIVRGGLGSTQPKTDLGITLIALVITIIVLLILAGVSLKLIAGGDGILGKAEKAVNLTNESLAREKLELVLAELQADKYTDEKYNEGQYINDKIKENGMSITGNIVIVDGWKFEIDRPKLQIVASLGKGEKSEIQDIQITSEVKCNEIFSQATITYVIKYNGELKNIQIHGENVEIPAPMETEDGKQYTITKQVADNGNYEIYVTDINEAYKTANAKVQDLASDLNIKTVEDLVAFRNKVNQGATFEGKTVTLMNDIDLSSVCGDEKGNWTPIGNVGEKENLCFNGTFDGNGKTISGIYINTQTKCQGLFGKLGINGTIKKLTTRGTMNSYWGVGGTVAINQGTVELCTNYVVLQSDGSKLAMYGGVVGCNEGLVSKCINYAGLTGWDSVGGIVGSNIGVIKDCVNHGNIGQGAWVAGGIVGSNDGVYWFTGNGDRRYGVSRVFNCYNIGLMNGTYVGGIVGEQGFNSAPAGIGIYNCYSINQTNLIGWQVAGTMQNCYTTEANTKLADLNTGIDEVGGTDTEQPWIEDRNNVNGGYPILNWQN